MKHMLFGFDSLDAGLDAIQKLSEIRPYYFTFMDKNFVTFLNKKGGSLPEKEITLGITIEIKEGEEKEGAVINACRSRNIPVAMTLGGGYLPNAYQIQYLSINYLIKLPNE